jgi:hypothetical protein
MGSTMIRLVRPTHQKARRAKRTQWSFWGTFGDFDRSSESIQHANAWQSQFVRDWQWISHARTSLC